ncbi:MAG: AMP-binding protein [Gammaproteobacteria bacterium]|nr:AMP-binding protein [Gammaproteobacteria bacterium]MYF66077.1 AMP-binding protein [Gammaproteobacteria bacterium]MYK38456.1 AMP-binding protein [Gammaproteobacteria bacterium]
MLQHRFIETARKHPKKVAIRDKATHRDVTYSQALLGALILARRFQKLERGRIGILLPTSSGSALAVVGALMGGLTPVMINYSTGAAKNCEYAQAQCDFRTIITARALLERIGCEELPGMVFMEDIMAGLGRREKLLAYLKSRLPLERLKRIAGSGNLDSPAVILFTSGSEKDPKGVQLTQRNILSNIDSFSDMMDLHGMDRMLAVLPCFHVFGLTIHLWTPLCLGMTSITYPNPLDFKVIARLIKEEKPQLLVGTPFFLEGYARQSRPGDFASVELAVAGADKCPDSLRQLYRDKHKLEILEGYGTTETSPVISVNPRDGNRPGSIGVPIPGTRVRIENIDSGEDCAPGETGKIMVKGEGVMSGYLNDMAESHLRLKSGWYDTGDLGVLDEDGYLWHKGRLKRFAKIGGEMISLVNVEETLDSVIGEDVACCAVELPDARRGSRIIAVTNKPIDERDVAGRLAEQLPNLALPKQYVVVEELPVMGSGKIDFRTLTEIVRRQEGNSRG